MKDLKYLIRPNIQALALEHDGLPARAAADEGEWLDANESPYNAPLNRYPDARQQELKELLSRLRGLRPDCLFPAGGVEELVDTLLRLFCIPQKDNVVSVEPTCPLYGVRAAVNDVEYRRVALNADFSLPVERVLGVVNANTKLILLCSPNSPTGNLLDAAEILRLADSFNGMVVVDETYVDFGRSESLRQEVAAHHNLVVLESFSVGWASAGLRLGVAYAVPQVVAYMNLVRTTWNLSTPVLAAATDLVRRRFDVDKWVKHLLEERGRVMAAVAMLPFCEKIFPSDANFFMVRVRDAERLQAYLASCGIYVQAVGHRPMCENCLRITVGSPQANRALLAALRRYS